MDFHRGELPSIAMDGWPGGQTGWLVCPTTACLDLPPQGAPFYNWTGPRLGLDTASLDGRLARPARSLRRSLLPAARHNALAAARWSAHKPWFKACGRERLPDQRRITAPAWAEDGSLSLAHGPRILTAFLYPGPCRPFVGAPPPWLFVLFDSLCRTNFAGHQRWPASGTDARPVHFVFFEGGLAVLFSAAVSRLCKVLLCSPLDFVFALLRFPLRLGVSGVRNSATHRMEKHP